MQLSRRNARKRLALLAIEHVAALAASAVVLSACTYDFDAPFSSVGMAGTWDSGVHGDAGPDSSAPPEAGADGTDATWPEASSDAGDGDAYVPDGCTPQCGGKCAGANDGCGSTCASDSCGPLQVCGPGGSCCTPATCASLGAQCGAHDDGCGHTLECGGCGGSNEYCLDNNSCTALSFAMVSIPAGVFQMGSPATEAGRDVFNGWSGELDETRHQVTLTHGFEIADIEITQSIFQAVTGYNPSQFQDCGATCPVEEITWDESAAFCNRLSAAKRLPSCFECTGTGPNVSCSLSPAFSTPYDCTGFRLPTEAEWEMAARGGTSTAFFNGAVSSTGCDPVDPSLDAIGWYLGNGAVSYAGGIQTACSGNPLAVGTHPVRQRAANPRGLWDVAGNVWEWTMDCAAPYGSTPQVNPVGPLSCGASARVFRGGGLGNEAALCRHAERVSSPGGAGGRNLDLGVRPARTAN